MEKSNARLQQKRLRVIGSGERLFHLVSKRIQTHFCIAAEVSGCLDLAKLRVALQRVSRRHPLLSARIERDVDGGMAVFRTELPIDLKVVPSPSLNWIPLVRCELCRPFSDTYGPLLRVTVLQSYQGATIVLTFHHTLADGLSGIQVLNDLLEALAGRRLEPTGVPESLERYAEQTLGTVSREAHPPAHNHAAVSSGQDLPNHGSGPRIRTILFDQRETEHLRRKSREQRTTVHGAICAALASTSALQRLSGEYNVLNPVNIRTAVGAPDDVCSLLVTAIPTRLAIGPTADFWAEARKVSHELVAAKGREALRSSLAAMQAAVPLGATFHDAFRVFTGVMATEAVVTNLGALKIGRDFGELALKAVWGPIASAGSLDVPVFGVTGFGGCVRVVETAPQYHESVLDQLKAALMQASKYGIPDNADRPAALSVEGFRTGLG